LLYQYHLLILTLYHLRIQQPLKIFMLLHQFSYKAIPCK
jgi:hypothetical protein